MERWVRFGAVGLGGIGVQMGTLVMLVHVLAVNYAVATVVAVAAAIVHNFVWHRAWTWRDRSGVPILLAFARFAGANGLVSLLGNFLVMTLSVGVIGLDVLPANTIAIMVCGVANFYLADLSVFKEHSRCAATILAYSLNAR
jgi:putative flippase GtrA